MRQGEVGGCTRGVQTAWPCLGSAVERSCWELGGPFRHRKLPTHPLQTPCLHRAACSNCTFVGMVSVGLRFA